MGGIDHYPVTYRDGVFNNNEQTCNHVLYQLLGTETYGQADDTGTGQERSNIDPQIGHGGNGADHHQNHFDRVTHQRQDGFDPRTRRMAGLKRQMAARCFWMKSATCR